MRTKTTAAATAMFGLLAVSGAASAVQVPTQYRLVDLGVMAETPSVSLLINDAGFIAMGDQLVTPSGSRIALGGWAAGINGLGTVVGSMDLTAPTRSGFRTTADGVTSPVAPSYSEAAGINDLGAIVGFSAPSATQPYRAVLFGSSGTQDLGIGDWSTAARINSSGTIVGTANTNSTTGTSTAFIYDAGVITLISAPESSGTYGSDINNAGMVVGSFSRLGPGGRAQGFAFSYDDGVFTQIGANQALQGSAWAVNDQGWIVGPGRFGVRVQQVGYLWDGSTARDINSLIVDADGWSVHLPTDINSRGDIVALANRLGETHYVLLSAIPEPAPCILFSVGALAVGASVSRRKRGPPPSSAQPLGAGTPQNIAR